VSQAPPSYCRLPRVPERRLAPEIAPERARLLLLTDRKWINGTTLRVAFLGAKADSRRQREHAIVREAITRWRKIGLGVTFVEAARASGAEVRIGFTPGDGTWSYVGRDVLEVARNEPTMNFGWSLAGDPRGIDTAAHEIGHTLGFPHEHQNPKAGIVWDEEAVYATLGSAPNFWDRETTYHNILRKLGPEGIRGSRWDPNSIMHYAFPGGLIREPERYREGLVPRGGLSARDRTWARAFYPPLHAGDYQRLVPHRAVPLGHVSGVQRHFHVRAGRSGKHVFRILGASDVLLVLFERVGREVRFRAGDDDSGEDRNAEIHATLSRGRDYILRARLAYLPRGGGASIVMW